MRTSSVCRCLTLVWQASRYRPLMYIAHEPQMEARQQ